MESMLYSTRNQTNMGGQTSSIRFPRWVQTVVIGRRPGWTLVRLGLLIIGAFVIFNFVLTPPVRVTGISMLPTYHTGQINFINRIAYLRHEPRRGDVIGVRFSGESRLLMKRIVALPGETIAFSYGFILINGQPLDEHYVKMRSD